MKQLASLLPVAGMVAVLGIAGSALASHSLSNGDAETGDMTDWDHDAEVGAVTSSSSGEISGPNGGTYFFSTGEGDVGDGGSAGMDQDVFVWGCGVENLQGMYTVAGWSNNGSADEDSGLAAAAFFDALDNPLGGSNSGALTTTGDSWESFSFGPNTVPENAATMNVELTGTEAGDDLVADVGFDDLSITLTGCLDDFAKISGKAGSGNRGTWSFSGTVGTSHDDSSLVGFIDINYKNLSLLCTFTPTDLNYPVETTAEVEADYDCNSGTLTGTANMRLIGALGGSNSGGGKDRGSICVDAEADDQLDIDVGVDSLCDADGDAVDLKNGNVHVDGDTADVF